MIDAIHERRHREMVFASNRLRAEKAQADAARALEERAAEGKSLHEKYRDKWRAKDGATT